MQRKISSIPCSLYASVVILYVTTNGVVGKQYRWRHVRVALYYTTHTETTNQINTAFLWRHKVTTRMVIMVLDHVARFQTLFLCFCVTTTRLPGFVWFLRNPYTNYCNSFTLHPFPRKPMWMDLHQIWHIHSSHGHNQLKNFLAIVEGMSVVYRVKIYPFLLKWGAAETTTLAYHAACQYYEQSPLAHHLSTLSTNLHSMSENLHLLTVLSMTLKYSLINSLISTLQLFTSLHWTLLPQKLGMLPWLIDWVVVLRPTWHKIGHFGDVSQANLLAWYGKTKPDTTKARIHQSK